MDGNKFLKWLKSMIEMDLQNHENHQYLNLNNGNYQYDLIRLDGGWEMIQQLELIYHIVRIVTEFFKK